MNHLKNSQNHISELNKDPVEDAEILVAGLSEQFEKTKRRVEQRSRLRRIKTEDKNRVFSFRR